MPPARNIDPVNQLEQAVHTVPPDVAAARSAIAAVANQLPTVNEAERADIIQKTAALAGQLATSVLNVRRFKHAKAASEEFATHANTYGAIAQLLGVAVQVQAAPTQTAGKAQTGGKS